MLLGSLLVMVPSAGVMDTDGFALSTARSNSATVVSSTTLSAGMVTVS